MPFDLLSAVEIPDEENLEIDIPDDDISDDEIKHLSVDDTVYPLIPRDYQMEGSMFLRVKRRAMCTDDAGLGKTLTSALAAKGPTIVTAPSYLTGQWFDFLTHQFPNHNVTLAEGSRVQRTRSIRTSDMDWYIVNHQMFRSYEMPTHNKTLIVDEAHHFRNRGSGQTKGLFAYAEENPETNIYLLTASPTYTSVDNLWSLFHILQPDLFPSYNQFVDMYCMTTFTPYGNKVIGTRRTRRAELRKLLDFCRIGRTYREVGRYLPPIVGHAVKCELPKEVRKLYNDVHYRYKVEYTDEETGQPKMMPYMSASAMMHTLRAVTVPAKIAAAMDRLEDLPPTTKMVIGCWYIDTAESMAKAIIDRQAKDSSFRPGKVVCITGKLSVAERHAVAMSGDTVVATIGSLSEGVNLYHMRAVMFIEEHYSPGANYQLLRRVRRDRNDDGRDREPVLVDYVYVTKTVDEVIHVVARKRGSTAKEVLDEIFQ